MTSSGLSGGLPIERPINGVLVCCSLRNAHTFALGLLVLDIFSLRERDVA